MIWKVLKTNIKISQLSAAFIGVLCGLTMLMSAISFYTDIKPVFQDREGFWSEEYIVINKNIHLSDSYHQIFEQDISRTSFNQEEIEELKEMDFIRDLAIFTASTFSVRVFTDDQGPAAGFYSDLFFEAVPDKFIDVSYDDWKWEEGMIFVPIILPRNYLNLYNFGFAQSQNLPQISEDAISSIKFNFAISGNNEILEFESRIIGFSDRINTFLVPQSFIDWGNKNFGTDESPEPGRLIVITNDPASPDMMQYFQEKEYIIDTGILSSAKALFFLRIIITIVLIIGIIIIALAFWVMIISLLLLLERNHDNISKLSLLGYSLNQISKPYSNLIIILLFSMYFISFIPLLIFRNIYLSALVKMGYDTSSGGLFYIAVPVFIFVIIVVAYLILYIKKQIKNIIIPIKF